MRYVGSSTYVSQGYLSEASTHCMGRDQFERFCMDSGYRIKRLKNFRVTTNSLGVTRFPNMIKDIKLHVSTRFL